MKLEINHFSDNVINFMRACSYAFLKKDGNELSFVRRLAGEDYPRFHIYTRQGEEKSLVINLHLDQKKPSYEGSTAHGGEYDGELVNEEIKRIATLAKPAPPNRKKLTPW